MILNFEIVIIIIKTYLINGKNNTHLGKKD